jgi:hypothetical protein
MRLLAKEGTRVIRFIPALTLVVLLCGGTVANAQSVMPVETVQPDGTVAPQLALTPSQRSAVYNTVRQQRVPAGTHGVTPSVGAPVPPSLALRDVPETPALADGDPNGDNDVLKYATVEGDVVVVDPIHMRVVEVIHSGVGP